MIVSYLNFWKYICFFLYIESMFFYCYLLLSPGGFGHLQIFMWLPYIVINLFLCMHVQKLFVLAEWCIVSKNKNRTVNSFLLLAGLNIVSIWKWWILCLLANFLLKKMYCMCTCNAGMHNVDFFQFLL